MPSGLDSEAQSHKRFAVRVSMHACFASGNLEKRMYANIRYVKYLFQCYQLHRLELFYDLSFKLTTTGTIDSEIGEIGAAQRTQLQMMPCQ